MEAVRASGWPVVCVQDAYRLMPWADVLYGCDERWWNAHQGTDFEGEKWSTHGDASGNNDKREIAAKYGVKLIQGRSANDQGFSTDPAVVHYGDNSGYQALNLALHLTTEVIILVGFDMRRRNGKAHFFGDHPEGLTNQQHYEQWAPHFERSKDTRQKIINATPGSAITCWPVMTIGEAFENHRVHRYRALAHG